MVIVVTSKSTSTLANVVQLLTLCTMVIAAKSIPTALVVLGTVARKNFIYTTTVLAFVLRICMFMAITATIPVGKLFILMPLAI